jgi:hypothetical protein
VVDDGRVDDGRIDGTAEPVGVADGTGAAQPASRRPSRVALSVLIVE